MQQDDGRRSIEDRRAKHFARMPQQRIERTGSDKMVAFGSSVRVEKQNVKALHFGVERTLCRDMSGPVRGYFGRSIADIKMILQVESPERDDTIFAGDPESASACRNGFTGVNRGAHAGPSA